MSNQLKQIQSFLLTTFAALALSICSNAAFADAASVFANINDCKAMFGDGKPEEADAYALITDNAELAVSQDAKAMIANNIDDCSTTNCTAYVMAKMLDSRYPNDSAKLRKKRLDFIVTKFCSVENCKAFVFNDASYCTYDGVARDENGKAKLAVGSKMLQLPVAPLVAASAGASGR